MSYDVERYLNVRSAYGASFTPRGDLAFLTNTTGVPQVWRLDGPGRWPDQRTFYDERVTFVSASPEREEVVFGMDRGGNERAQLYRLADGEATNLTGRPGAKHRWGGWSHDGDRFAFASNRREESVFDVYVQGRTAGEAERVLDGEGWLTVGGWSPGDDRLLVTEAHSNFDQDVYVLDLETGDLEHLTPHDGTVRHRSVEWGPDGEALYLVTDRDRDTLALCRLDLDGGFEPLVEDEWNVDGVAIDRDSRRLVYSRNVEGYTDLSVGELGPDGREIRTLPDPALPAGLAGGVSFDAGGRRFAVTVTGSRMNTNVFVVDVATGEATRWTDAATAGIPRERFRDPDLVRYESFDGREIPAFFTLPADASDGDTPVIVDVHGGPESQRRPSFHPVKQYFLDRGYAVFEPNVRGSTGYGTAYTHLDDVDKRMDAVEDVRAGVEWLHDRPSVDPDRVAAMGASYGGFVVLATLTEHPDLWAAGVDVVGIANFVTFLENTGSWRRALREAEYGSLEADRELLERISPINNVESIEAPLFVVHGENDPRVPVGEAEQVADRARKQGVPVRKLVFEDEGHGLSKLENRIEAYGAIAEFLDEHLG